MDYKAIIDKSIPLQGKMIAKGMSTLMGCSSPNNVDSDEDSTDIKPSPLYKTGEQVCYANDTDTEYITLLEDTVPGSLVVKAQHADGKKFYANVEDILSNMACMKYKR
jgi:hypothetical protein